MLILSSASQGAIFADLMFLILNFSNKRLVAQPIKQLMKKELS